MDEPKKYVLLYKNYLGMFNILISKTAENPYTHTQVTGMDIANAHLWINDWVVQKDHTNMDVFPRDKLLNQEDIIKFFSVDIRDYEK